MLPRQRRLASMQAQMQNKATPNEINMIAGESVASVATVRRFLSGKPVRPSSSTRISRAIEALGLGHVLPKQEAAQ